MMPGRRASDSMRSATRLGQRLAAAFQIPDGCRRVAVAGWMLYAISWITPSSDARQVGATAFIATVKFAAALLTAGTTSRFVLGACVAFGWLANVSIFIRLCVWARAGWSAAPWFTFAVVLFTVPVRPSIPQRAAFFLYFYPWALGIGLIHWANIVALRRAALTGALR
jgi:hypothetical protein